MKKWLSAGALSVVLTAGGIFAGGGQPYLFEPGFSGENEVIQGYHSDDFPKAITGINGEGIAISGFIHAKVIKVADGDTVTVEYRGHSYRVRFLDIDTPEFSSKNAIDREYARKAASFTADHTLGKLVKLIFEERLTDRYGRLLAHVFLENGEYLNGLLIKEGLARDEIIEPNSAAEEWFEAAIKAAIDEKAGFWALPEDKRPFSDTSR